MWKHDNFFIGALAAIVAIVVSAAILIFLVPFIYQQGNFGVPQFKVLLFAIFPAVIVMRYYFRTLRFGKSGMGALVIVFGSIILYFLLLEGKITTFPVF